MAFSNNCCKSSSSANAGPAGTSTDKARQGRGLLLHKIHQGGNFVIWYGTHRGGGSEHRKVRLEVFAWASDIAERFDVLNLGPHRTRLSLTNSHHRPQALFTAIHRHSTQPPA